MMAKEKLKTIWEQSGDLVCGELEDGRYYTGDNAGGLVLPKSEANKEFIKDRYDIRKKERENAV